MRPILGDRQRGREGDGTNWRICRLCLSGWLRTPPWVVWRHSTHGPATFEMLCASESAR